MSDRVFEDSSTFGEIDMILQNCNRAVYLTIKYFLDRKEFQMVRLDAFFGT
jgi:hypothetical protein